MIEDPSYAEVIFGHTYPTLTLYTARLPTSYRKKIPKRSKAVAKTYIEMRIFSGNGASYLLKLSASCRDACNRRIELPTGGEGGAWIVDLSPGHGDSFYVHIENPSGERAQVCVTHRYEPRPNDFIPPNRTDFKSILPRNARNFPVPSSSTIVDVWVLLEDGSCVRAVTLHVKS